MGGLVRVAIVGARDVVDTGLRTILANVSGIELVNRRASLGDVAADVVLYDALALASDAEAGFLLQVKHAPAVIMIARDLRPDLAARALAQGAAGAVSVDADASAIIAAIRQVASTGKMDNDVHELGWEASLTLREIEVLRGISKGLSNEEIADSIGISINTLKSYVRGAYRRIGVANRSQAAVWCLQHGFEPPESGHRR